MPCFVGRAGPSAWVSRARRRLGGCLAAAAWGGGKFRSLRAPGGELFASVLELAHKFRLLQHSSPCPAWNLNQ